MIADQLRMSAQQCQLACGRGRSAPNPTWSFLVRAVSPVRGKTRSSRYVTWLRLSAATI